MTGWNREVHGSVTVDEEIIHYLKEAGVDFACGVPCSMLRGVLERIGSHIMYISVTREEEGVGVCVGAFMGGRRPVLLMQNSGLGNCVNAMLSLVKLYRFPLLLLIAHRGGRDEEISAHIPMGKATPRLLEMMGIEYERVIGKTDLVKIRALAERTFNQNKMSAMLFSDSLWKE